jgi:hypothetical protein
VNQVSARYDLVTELKDSLEQLQNRQAAEDQREQVVNRLMETLDGDGELEELIGREMVEQLLTIPKDFLKQKYSEGRNDEH